MHSPRASCAVFLFSMLNSLKQLIPVNESDIQEALRELDNLAGKIQSSNLTESNPSLGLAEWMSGIPLLYYPWGFRAAVIRFKNSLQENAKTHCFAENIIETCHNGIVAWEQPSIVKPILIQGQDDSTKTKQRWKILKDYFKENQIDYQEITSVRLEFQEQTEFLEPRIRINTDPPDLCAVEWSEEEAWDQIAAYYRLAFGCGAQQIEETA